MVFVPMVAPRSRRGIEHDAEGFIRLTNPGLLEQPGRFPVIRFFDDLKERFGLDPAVEVLPDGVEGMTWPDGRVVLSEETYRKACDGDGRARFTVAHECYHGIAHKPQIQHVLIHTREMVLFRKDKVPPYRNPEWQANAFASALLMPADLVRRLVAGVDAHRRLSPIMRAFGVSRRAAEVRLKVLGI